MKLYRYNTSNRANRKFNNCEVEKNPNNIKFYGKTLNYVESYKFIYNEDGEVVEECVLEEKEVSGVNLFDMVSGFKNLKTYASFLENEIGSQKRDYEFFLSEASTKKEKKIWENNLSNLSNRESELITMLTNNEFQTLSDFDLQNELLSELKSLGFDGYETTNEIAIF